MRHQNRSDDALRDIQIQFNATKHAEGSILYQQGDTHVLCHVSLVGGVPRFLKGKNQGWLTAEYGMLPRATHSRGHREAVSGKQSGRTQEIQRLIGRTLRNAVDLKALGEYTLYIDCDVIQADGGTRCASITGAGMALELALTRLTEKGTFKKNPFKQRIAAISVGLKNDKAIVDLDYHEDSQADTDMNIVFNEAGQIVEIQGTGEEAPFDVSSLNTLVSYAHQGTQAIFKHWENDMSQQLAHDLKK